jgi:hypothetical protein
MKRLIRPPVSAPVLSIVICGALATHAHAWLLPWERESVTTSSQTAIDPEAVPSNLTAAAAAMPSHRRKSVPSKVSGTVENVDPENRRFILKTSAGKSESFRLARSSVVLLHHRKLALSALRAGEIVIVRCRPGSNAAVRVYILGDGKA